MKVSAIRVDQGQDCCELRARITCDRSHYAPFDCWLRFPREYQPLLIESADPFLALTLLPAMILGEPLHLEGAVSPTLLANAERLQQIYRRWVAGTRTVSITINGIATTATAPGSGGVGCFFSGGVDSFHSLLKHQQHITHLILISGFDRGLRNPAILEKARIALRAVAAASGKQALEVSTNIREFTDPFARWGFYHGGVLAAVSLALARGFNTFIVPSSYSYDQLHPWGSHPLLDPLWSIPGMEVVHDGCEVNRHEKLARIAHSDLALAHLRVCWESGEENEYNCGRCEKCLRTMTGLYLHGVLSRCRTFTTPLTPRAFRKIRIKSSGQVAFTEENLRELARRKGTFDKALYRAMRWAIRRGQIRRALKALAGHRRARDIAEPGIANQP
jgi:hypothetical protein